MIQLAAIARRYIEEELLMADHVYLGDENDTM